MTEFLAESGISLAELGPVQILRLYWIYYCAIYGKTTVSCCAFALWLWCGYILCLVEARFSN